MLAAPMRRRRGAAGGEVRLNLKTPDGPVAWTIGGDADLKVFAEVAAGDYEVGEVSDPRTILDIGAHVGTTVLYFRRRFPDARIIAFEPDPLNFAKLEKNVGHLPGVELQNVALAESDGPVEFYSSGANDSWASGTRQTRPWQTVVEVQGRSLDSLLEELGIEDVDLMKIDIEGAEYDVLATFEGLARTRFIVGEVHPTQTKNAADLKRILHQFRSDLPAGVERATIFRAARTDEAPAA